MLKLYNIKRSGNRSAPLGYARTTHNILTITIAIIIIAIAEPIFFRPKESMIAIINGTTITATMTQNNTLKKISTPSMK